MSLVTIPYSFTSQEEAFSAQVNANFTALANTINGNIDNTNIGTAGIYASQIVPTSAAQATFGGSQPYVFPTAVSASTLTGGNVASSAQNAGVTGLVPPVFTATGTQTQGTEHIVRGTVNVSFVNGQQQATASVTLTGAAKFSSSGTYQIFTNIVLAELVPPGTTFTSYTAWSLALPVTASTFQVIVGLSQVAQGSGEYLVGYMAIGY